MKILDIALCNCCTYRCDYCYSNASQATAHNYKTPHGTIGIYSPNGVIISALSLLGFIEKNFETDWIIQLGGGEPLLHPAFEFILRHLNKQGYDVVVNTNANQIKNLSEECLAMARWRVSWHRDFRDINAFLADIEPLEKRKEQVLVNYVAHPKRIESRIIYEDLIDLELTAKTQSGWNYEVTAFEGDWEANGLTYNKTWQGYAGIITPLPIPSKISYISIRPDGLITKCHNGDTLGNIYTSDKLVMTPPCECSLLGHSLCATYASFTRLGIVVSGKCREAQHAL
jgi:MoaA/NifB/PqqE/SkfB family radical SAM enzyme